uniref:Uncharacterized protein n=1 Tax=Schizaphis graminum TaxID=13262 RepID=A0A2S2NEP6_SCHGA
MTPKHEPQKQMESAAARPFDRRYARACARVFPSCVACVRACADRRRELRSSSSSAAAVPISEPFGGRVGAMRRPSGSWPAAFSRACGNTAARRLRWTGGTPPRT